jgi:hypothetical protein|tara:strand:+ start:572 stop:874 length:303 start_codon:yes stop_codon:yes gene_type:complete
MAQNGLGKMQKNNDILTFCHIHILSQLPPTARISINGLFLDITLTFYAKYSLLEFLSKTTYLFFKWLTNKVNFPNAHTSSPRSHSRTSLFRHVISNSWPD